MRKLKSLILLIVASVLDTRLSLNPSEENDTWNAVNIYQHKINESITIINEDAFSSSATDTPRITTWEKYAIGILFILFLVTSVVLFTAWAIYKRFERIDRNESQAFCKLIEETSSVRKEDVHIYLNIPATLKPSEILKSLAHV